MSSPWPPPRPVMAHRYPESALFYRRLDRDFPLAVRGEGAWIVDEAGRRYLDACGGALVVSARHGVAGLAAAAAAPARPLRYRHPPPVPHAARPGLAVAPRPPLAPRAPCSDLPGP